MSYDYTRKDFDEWLHIGLIRDFLSQHFDDPTPADVWYHDFVLASVLLIEDELESNDRDYSDATVEEILDFLSYKKEVRDEILAEITDEAVDAVKEVIKTNDRDKIFDLTKKLVARRDIRDEDGDLVY